MALLVTILKIDSATGLTAFQSDAPHEYNGRSSIITVPIVGVYVFLHKKIMNGISLGGTKG